MSACITSDKPRAFRPTTIQTPGKMWVGGAISRKGASGRILSQTRVDSSSLLILPNEFRTIGPVAKIRSWAIYRVQLASPYPS